LAELNVKLQERETTFVQLDRQRQSLADNIEHLKHRIDSDRNGFEVEHNSQEQLPAEDNQKLKQQREEQFHTLNDNFTTDRFETLSRDSDQLQQQVDQVTSKREQLKGSQQQNDEKLIQHSNQVTTELQITENMPTNSQILRKELQEKELKLQQLSITISSKRQQFTTGANRFREHIHTLKQAVDTQQKELLQVCTV